MNKKEFKTRISDITSNEYSYYKDYETFYDLKGFLLEQNKETYFNFVDYLEGIYLNYYDKTSSELEDTYSTLREALEELYNDTIKNSKFNIDIKFIDNNDGTFDFTVNGVSFFDENFISEVVNL